MVVETVVISSISVYFMLRLNKSDTRVAQLENHVRTLYQKNNLLEKVLQELINIMPSNTQNKIKKIIQGQPRQEQINHQPKKVYTHTPDNTPPPQTPPPPQANPLESIMSMMAPMMSSMIMGDNTETEADVVSEMSSQISDAEICEELQELQELQEGASDLELDLDESDTDQKNDTENHESDVEKENHERDTENHESEVEMDTDQKNDNHESEEN